MNTENIFEYEYVTYEELYDAYLECRQYKRHTVNALKFEINESELLNQLYIDLNTKTYIIGKSIAFVVNEPKPREIFAADFRDRIVHHLIIRRILKYIESNEWIQDTYSTRIGKGTLYGIKRIEEQIKTISNNYTEETWVMKLDLRACFVSVNKDMLYEWLSTFLTTEYTKQINEIKLNNATGDLFIMEDDSKCTSIEKELEFNLWVIKLIVYNKPQDNCIRKMSKAAWNPIEPNKSLFGVNKNEDRGFAVGNLTSQIFVNFFLSKLDHYIVYELGFNYYDSKNEGYGRYVDDFIVISKDKSKLLDAHKKIDLFLKNEMKLMLSPTKCYIQEVKKGINFIGATLKPGRIYILNRTKNNFYKKMKQWHIYAKRMTQANKEIPYEDLQHFVSVVNSFLGTLSQFNTFNIRKRILTKTGFMKYWEKFVYIDTLHYTKIKIKKDVKKLYMDILLHNPILFED